MSRNVYLASAPQSSRIIDPILSVRSHPMKYRRKFLLPLTETGIGEVKSSRKSTGVKTATGGRCGPLSDRDRDGNVLGPTKLLRLSFVRLLLTDVVEECSKRDPHL